MTIQQMLQLDFYNRPMGSEEKFPAIFGTNTLPG
jgi:hypothetical protein